MRNLIILSMLLFLSACATTAPKKTVNDLVSPEAVGPELLEGLSYGDLVSLDKSVFLVEVKSKNLRVNKEKYKKGAMVVVNDKYKQSSALNMPLISLKHWLKKQLGAKEYIIEGYLHGKTPILILVQYGQSPMEQTKGLNLYMRYVRLIAVDYQEYKKSKNLVPYWEGQVSSVGPRPRAEEVIHVLGAFLDKTMESTGSKRYLIPTNDPLLEKTKDVPSSIVIDDLKPSLEELEFFN